MSKAATTNKAAIRKLKLLILASQAAEHFCFVIMIILFGPIVYYKIHLHKNYISTLSKKVVVLGATHHKWGGGSRA